MRRNCFKFILALAVVFCCLPSHAQRQTPGRPSLDAYVTLGWPGTNYFGVRGGGFAWRNYSFIGCTSLGLDFSLLPADYHFTHEPIYDKDGTEIAPYGEEDYHYTAIDLTAAEGYYLRLLSTRNRALIVSLGATLHEGIRICPDAKYIEMPMTGFVLSGEPELLIEFFPFNSVSFFVSAKARMTMVNTLKVGNWFRYGFGTGLKVYL